MNKDIRQKLFDYFHEEHGIMLLDGDYNEIEHILKSKPSSVLTDESLTLNQLKKKVKEFLEEKGYDWVHKKLNVYPQRGMIVNMDNPIDIRELMNEFAYRISQIEGAKFARDRIQTISKKP